MIYQKDLIKFRYVNVQTLRWPRMYNWFIFLEDANDVVSLYGAQYENTKFNNVTNREISIIGGRYYGFPQPYIIDLLQQTINFKVRKEVTDGGFILPVLLGFNDINLMRITDLSSTESLFPTTKRANQLWVVNMDMIGTPTFFIDMFTDYLWIAFFVSFLLIGIASTLGLYLLRRYTKTRSDYLTWFSLITNQGGEELPGVIFPKVLLVALSMIAIIFHGSFEAFLSSYLAIRLPDLPFTNLDGLLKVRDFSVCIPSLVEAYTYVSYHFKLNGIHNHLNDHHCPQQFNTYDTNTVYFRVPDYCPTDKTVFISTNKYDFTNKNCSAYNIIPLAEKYFPKYESFFVSPGFKYREQFNRGLIRIRTAGFLVHQESILEKRNKEIELHLNQIDYSNLPIDFHQTKIILFLLLVGLIVAIVILVLERVIKNRI